MIHCPSPHPAPKGEKLQLPGLGLLRLAALSGGLILAIAGQMALATAAEGLRGVVLQAVAVALFLVAVAGLPRRAAPAPTVAGPDEAAPPPAPASGSAAPGISSSRGVSWRGWGIRAVSSSELVLTVPRDVGARAVLLLLSAIAWVGAVQLGLPAGQLPETYRLSLWLWVASLAGFVVALFPTVPREGWGDRLRAARLELVAVAVLTLFALALRAYDLNGIPYPFQGDEGSVGSEGKRIVDGVTTRFFDAGWSGQPIISFFPTALFIAILGPDITAARLWSAVEGTATVPLLYLLGRRMFNRRVGIVAAFFLATCPFHLHFSRLAVNNIGDAFFATLVGWLIVRATQEHRAADYGWAGIATGFTWYSYAGTRLVFGLAGLYLLAVLVRTRGGLLRSDWRGLAAFAGGILIAAGPQLLYFWERPDALMTRVNASSIIQTGALAREAAAQNVSPLLIIWDGFVRSFMVFISAPASPGMFNAPGPLLDRLPAALFVPGLLYCTLRVTDPRFLYVAALFWSVLLFGGALTTDVPTVWRLVLAIPAVALCIGLAFSGLLAFLRRLSPLSDRAVAVIVLLVFIPISARAVAFYFFEYIPGQYLSRHDANTELGHVMGLYLRGLGPGYDTYFAGVPRIPYVFPSIPYLSLNPNGIDLHDRLTRLNMPEVPPGQNAVFVAAPERRPELELVREVYPGGVWREFQRSATPEVQLLLAYEVRRAGP